MGLIEDVQQSLLDLYDNADKHAESLVDYIRSYSHTVHIFSYRNEGRYLPPPFGLIEYRFDTNTNSIIRIFNDELSGRYTVSKLNLEPIVAIFLTIISPHYAKSDMVLRFDRNEDTVINDQIVYVCLDIHTCRTFKEVSDFTFEELYRVLELKESDLIDGLHYPIDQPRSKKDYSKYSRSYRINDKQYTLCITVFNDKITISLGDPSELNLYLIQSSTEI